MPAPYTDLLNETIDDVAATLTAVSGLRVVTDPTRLVPNCVFLLAPSFTTYGGNGNIVTMDFPLKVVGSGPAGLPVLREILQMLSLQPVKVKDLPAICAASLTARSLGRL